MNPLDNMRKTAIFFPVLNFEPKEIAEQLTLIESQFFHLIRKEEFLIKLWGDSDVEPVDEIAKNLVTCVERFNLVSLKFTFIFFITFPSIEH